KFTPQLTMIIKLLRFYFLQHSILLLLVFLLDAGWLLPTAATIQHLIKKQEGADYYAARSRISGV
ncbi:MAG TPA: hypothetical protein VK140_15565, partial [Ktedonobacteraceae bacterium]|nr:hypothetical protein [Ktedonobacteraceae bacterium]